MNLEDIETIAVIGAGMIGQGTAAEFALGGYAVRLHSRSGDSLDRGLRGISAILGKMVELGVTSPEAAATALTHVTPDPDLGSAVKSAQVVFEAVYENLELKQGIFRQAERRCRDGVLLVSGTSTLKLSALTAGLSRPENVVLANSSNPTYLVPLIEILRNEQTADSAVDTVCALYTAIGKKPAVIRKEVPGFVANRLQVALLREALHLIQSGVVTAQDIDLIMRSSIGRRWAVAGIFEVFELAGQDLTLSASTYLMPDLDTAREPAPVLCELVARGNLGVKSGRGFYTWTPEAARALEQRIARALVEIERWSD